MERGTREGKIERWRREGSSETRMMKYKGRDRKRRGKGVRRICRKGGRLRRSKDLREGVRKEGRKEGGRLKVSYSFDPSIPSIPFQFFPMLHTPYCPHHPLCFLILQELCVCFCSRWRMARCHLATVQ